MSIAGDGRRGERRGGDDKPKTSKQMCRRRRNEERIRPDVPNETPKSPALSQRHLSQHVRLVRLLALLGCFLVARLLVASIWGRALPMWNFCSSDKHAQSEGAGGRKVPRVGTHSTYSTSRGRLL